MTLAISPQLINIRILCPLAGVSLCDDRSSPSSSMTFPFKGNHEGPERVRRGSKHLVLLERPIRRPIKGRIYESLSIHRSGVPVACRDGGSLNNSNGSSHRSGIGDHHDGLVRRTRGSGIGAHGGPGFSMGRFLNLFMLLTFAYVMVNYYDSSIPGLGFSIKGFIDGGTINLVTLIGSDGSNTMLNEIHQASSKTGPSILNTVMNPYYAIVYFAVQFLLAMLAAIVSAIVAYGAIAATIIGVLGPIFTRSLSSTNLIGCSGGGSRRIWGSAFTRSSPQPR